jgi:hypothetical protein
MTTEELIRHLASQTPSVNRAAHPTIHFMKWCSICAICLALGIVTIGPREDLVQVGHRFEFVIHTLLVASLTGLAAMSAFILAIPDRERPWVVRLPMLAFAAWLAWIVVALLSADELHVGAGRRCVTNLATVGVPIGVMTFLLLRAATPLRKATFAWLAVLSVAAAADLATRFICRNDDPLHALAWHFAPVLLLGSMGLWIRKLFDWELPRRR